MSSFPLHLNQKQRQALRYLGAVGVVGIAFLLLARQTSSPGTSYQVGRPMAGTVGTPAGGSVPGGSPSAIAEGVPASGGGIHPSSSALPATLLADYSHELEKRLATVLAQVQGAGRVEVMISLADGGQLEYVGNQRRDISQSEEKDAQGVTRRSLQDQSTQEPLTLREGQNETLWLSRMVRPQIAGVLVVAEGAGVEAVRLRLMEAAATALGVPAHRVAVLPRRTGSGL
ncbi:MAG: hypothetical protein IMX01_06550 [Limnochordaceae bacterium]|nr:hypothetical protein [Limnochordaceae bacterium]